MKSQTYVGPLPGTHPPLPLMPISPPHLPAHRSANPATSANFGVSCLLQYTVQYCPKNNLNLRIQMFGAIAYYMYMYSISGFWDNDMCQSCSNRDRLCFYRFAEIQYTFGTVYIEQG